MGLCKCPKKKVTNIFCFEHRVNVCEYCLVSNHEKCIVKSYLQWLQDSDYNPNCPLCNKPLADEGCGPCVRLTCYDVFHWPCINKYASQLPQNTAPAGYTCPTCKAGLFPAQNAASPVVENLKKFLSKVNWARTGLGLPLIDEPESPPSPAPPSTPEVPHVATPLKAQETMPSLPSSTSTPLKPETQQTVSSATSSAPPLRNNVVSTTRPSAHVTPTQHSVISVDSGTSSRTQDKPYNSADPRKMFDTTSKGDSVMNLSHDHDEDKYKRRSATEWLGTWLKTKDGKHKKKDSDAMLKRFLFVLVIGLIGFITVVVFFSKYGRQAAENDPFLDPLANPNIRVQENVESVNN